MNYSTAIFIINDDCRAVVGQYEDNGKCHLFKTFDKEIDIEDYVVVESGTRHGMTVVKIVDIDVDVDLTSDVEVKWVIMRIDPIDHSLLIEKEQDARSAVAG